MKYFTILELTKSSTAVKYKINNVPNAEIQKKLVRLIEEILDPIRMVYGKPIKVTSGYRCPLLNAKVGGSPTSQHQRGEACDLNNGRLENIMIFKTAKKLIDEKKITVGQLINEKNYSWIHISLPDGKHKNQILNL